MRIFELEKLPPWETMKIEALRIGLEGCEVFKMLDDETKTKEWNGIGSDAMPKWLRDFLDTLHSEVMPAACIHDFRFVIGGTEADFHAANRELQRNMVKCVRYYRRNFTLVGYWLARIRIQAAFMLCEEFGMPGWRLKTDDND